jgi:uridine kinase
MPGAAESVTAVVAAARGVLDRHERVVIGIDGRSGAGKSTLAANIARTLGSDQVGVLVIDGDQFYAGGSSATWDRRSAPEKADLVIDWRRQYRVLEDLRSSGTAEWHPFDWDADDWDADSVPLAPNPIAVQTEPLVILEGAYSCRPELHDMLDLRVLLTAPVDVRHRRLTDREGYEYRVDWVARWSAAEDHYFGTVMTPDRFDLVLDSVDS